jgi:vacuolar-type H+-ATPase subunit I/STV1
MQKRYNIKWRESDEKELSKAVRKFNAKRTRLLKQVPELEEFLPPKQSVKTLRESIKTRRDFRNEINSIERFMQKGAEKPIVTAEGVKTTAYEKKELGIKIRAINARRAAERKRANVSTEKGTMGTIRANNLQPKQVNIDKIKKSDWNKFVESVEKQARDSYSQEKYERYKENFIKGLENAFGESGAELVALAEQIDPETLSQMYFDDPILQIDFIYDPLEMQVKIDAMTEHLQGYLETVD